MSWITIILILAIFVLFIIAGYILFDESSCCETGWRDVFTTIGIGGLAIFSIIFLIYTLNSERIIKVEKIEPSFITKSKTKVYLEFDKNDKHWDYTFSDANNYNSINDSTKFYYYESINHYSIHNYKIIKKSELPDLNDDELDKWIKNRW